MAQGLLLVGGQQVLAFAIVEADVHVHAAARVLQVGLGHEAGAIAVLEGDAPGAAAEQCGPVRGLQAVIEVAEVDLELAGPKLRGDHRGVDALGARGLDHFVEDRSKP
ncbi:hypothetical protein D3C78_624680 [compost metagenome]